MESQLSTDMIALLLLMTLSRDFEKQLELVDELQSHRLYVLTMSLTI